MQRLVTRIGNDPAVPTEFDMDFVFGLDKGTFDGLQRIFNNLCDLTDILGDDYDLGHLRELVEADRDGRCKVFKSKIGDTVYVVGESKIVEATILEMYILHDKKGVEYLVNFKCDENCKRCPFYAWEKDWEGEWGCDCEYGDGAVAQKDFGETVFLTREAAERALKGKRDG